MCQLLLCPPHSPHTRPIDGAESTRHRRVTDGRKCCCARRFHHADDGCRCAASACDEPCIHPPILTMRFAHCPTGAQDASQRRTDGVYRGRGRQCRPLVLAGALLQSGPTAALQPVCPSIASACLCALQWSGCWLPALCPVRASHTVDCVRLGVPGSAWVAPSDRVPTPRQSRDGVCPSPRDELQCAIERRNSSEIVLRFIKLSYMNTWCAWAALDRLPSALECAVKSSLVEGLVPRKLIGYPHI